VEVDGVLLEQIGTHDHADVGEREEELVVLIDRHHRRRDVAVHDADVHDRAGIDVSGVAGPPRSIVGYGRPWRACAYRVRTARGAIRIWKRGGDAI